MPKACEQCGDSLDLLKPGRVTRFCSARCRVAANRAVIPAELRTLDRWVCWTPAKRPIQIDGSVATSTDPATWTSYSRVRAHKRKGFVLGAGIGCIDLDHCVSGTRVTRAASALLDRLPDTYVELSPSGTGLHIWGFLPEEPGFRRTIDGLSVERYSRGRYITVTGQRWPGSVSRLAGLVEVAL